MNKVLVQGIISVLVFFSTWSLLKEVDWMEVFQVEKTTDETEEKLGDLIWESISRTEEEIKEIDVVNTIDSIVNHLCKENELDRDYLKVHVLQKDEINAFALPNGHLVIYSGLILNSDNQEELIGVVGHEIAHIQLNHVMKKLVREIGLSVLISMTTGNGGGEMIMETARMLSSTAFDRSMEKEADLKGVDYLIEAKVNPEPLANFLYRLATEEPEAAKYFAWISTHPDSKERAEYIIDYSSDKKVEFESILKDETWVELQKSLKDGNNL